MIVTTVASGGMGVVDGTSKGLGVPVREGKGQAVTKVTNGIGLPVQWTTIGGGAAPGTPTTWNAADLAAVTLSNGNLTATTTSAQGGVRGVAALSSGKNYCEYTIKTIISNALAVGFALASTNLATSGLVGAAIMNRLGAIFVNNVNSGVGLGTRAANDIIGIAVDISGKLIWFRVAPAGNWNASGTANPATGAGGISLTALSGALYPVFLSGGIGDAVTANFGATAFSGAVPSGFTSGWLA